MKKLFLSICLLCGIMSGIAQTIPWDSVSNWKLYNVHDFDAFNYSIESLDTLQAIPLDVDTMRSFLTDAVAWPHDKTSVWMGLYLASCQMPNGQKRKIEISVYGGFFYDELEHAYYQVKEGIRSDWLAYLSKKSLIMQH